MALEKLGLGALLTFDSKQTVQATKAAYNSFIRLNQATLKMPEPLSKFGSSVAQTTSKVSKLTNKVNLLPQAFNKAKNAASRFNSEMRKMGDGVNKGSQKISQGTRNIALGMTPATGALAFGAKKAIDFEKRMSAVGAVSLANKQQMQQLTNEARRQGIVSVFSATQSAEAMENLARAGFEPQQTIGALGGVINAASADEMELATASDIVASSIRAMGLRAEDATHVANVLANTSAKSNTNITQLGESFKFGAMTGKQIGMTIGELSATFGILANAGLKGSLAGTTFTNMVNKMAKPSEKARAIMKKWGINFKDNNNQMKKWSDIVDQFQSKMGGMNANLDRFALLQELAGMRGGRAMGALLTQGGAALEKLTNSNEQASEAFGGVGVAAEMARRRLDNVWGATILLTSSLESLAISLFQKLMGPMKGTIQSLTDGLNSVLFIMQEMENGFQGNFRETKGFTEAVKLLGKDGAESALQIALGFQDAMRTVRDGWNFIIQKFKSGGKWLERVFGKEGIRKITKFATLFLMVGGLVTPLILGLAAVKWVIGGIISVLSGLATIFSAVFWPAIIIAGILYSVYRNIRFENETLGQTISRVWGNISTWLSDIYNNKLVPFWEGIRNVFIPIVEELGKTWDGIVTNIKLVLTDLFTFFFGQTEMTKDDWKNTGQIIGAVIGSIAQAIGTFVKYAIPVIASIVIAIFKVVKFIWNTIKWVITNLVEQMAKFADAFITIFEGDLVSGVAKLGTAIIDFILTPFQWVIKALSKGSEALGLNMPQWLKTFAEEGVTGLAFGGEKGRKSGKTFSTRDEALISLGAKETERHKFKDIPSLKTKTEAAKKSEEAGLLEKIDGTLNDLLSEQKSANEQDKTTNINIDAEKIMQATGRKKRETDERAGGRATPWQKRMIFDKGVLPNRKKAS